MRELFYPEEQGNMGSESLGPVATPKHVSNGGILKGCSLGLIHLTLE